MKIVKENIDEAIKHLPGRPDEEINDNLKRDVIEKAIHKYDYANNDLLYDLSNLLNFKDNEEWIKSELLRVFTESMNGIFDEFVH